MACVEVALDAQTQIVIIGVYAPDKGTAEEVNKFYSELKAYYRKATDNNHKTTYVMGDWNGITRIQDSFNPTAAPVIGSR